MRLERTIGDDFYFPERVLQSEVDYEVVNIACRRSCGASPSARRPSHNSTPDGYQESSAGDGLWLHVEVSPYAPTQIVVGYVPTDGFEDGAVSL